MRSWIMALALGGAATLWAPLALPCGGGFGLNLNIGTDQKIFIAHKNGVETYFFAPHFCGESQEFGLILPIPSMLSSEPQLGETTLIAELEDVGKPTIEKVTKCYDRSGAGGGNGWADAGGGYNVDGGGVTVINKGQVGIFEWVQLQATDTKAFTSWLDANKYPYDTKATVQFQHYVDSGWYFVAFKVTADTQAPPAHQQLCGDFGPIMLSFGATSPVIPARITAATVMSGPYKYGWRAFVVSDTQKAVSSPDFTPTLRYSGALTSADVANHPAISKLTIGSAPVIAVGDRLTELQVEFYPGSLTKDLEFGVEPNPADFRRKVYEYTYVACDDAGVPINGEAPAEGEVSGGACATGRTRAHGGMLTLLVAIGAMFARRRKPL